METTQAKIKPFHIITFVVNIIFQKIIVENEKYIR